MVQKLVGVQAYVVVARVKLKKNKAGTVAKVAAKAKIMARVSVADKVKGDLERKYNHCKKGS